MARGRKKLKEKEESLIDISQKAEDLQKSYIDDLEVNPKYSLEVDPQNKYHMSEEQKKFIRYYVNFKSIPAVCELCGIEIEKGKQYFISFDTQQEIRRINLALYQRQFATKLLDLDQIGGYLSSLITEENVAIADKLKTVDKLKVVQMLIDLNMLKLKSFQNPQEIMSKEIDLDIKNLSITTIQQLLNTNKNIKEIPSEVIGENLSPEESAYLSTLSTKELLNILDENNKEENDVNQ